jgi:uncharacterized zinc-type alcohol dehydrogenase-like protein
MQFNHYEMPEPREDEYKEVAWGRNAPDAKFTPLWINRGKPTGKYVKFEMKYCGICHTDLHLANNDFGRSFYPIVPGHELCGVVVEVGEEVTKVKVGDKVGVGCIVDSCMECEQCLNGE